MDDVVLPQRDDEEDTEETTSDVQCDELADVVRWVLRQQVETVHGRDGRHKENSETSRGSSSTLGSTILLGTKATTEEPAGHAR